MPSPRPKPFELDSARATYRERSETQPHPGSASVGSRLAAWREERIALQALRIAGEPNLMLDLCGSGRFWPLLTRHPNRLVLAADDPAGQLAQPDATKPAEMAQRICVLPISAGAIDLGENAVDSIFCMGLLQRIETVDRRLSMLREFHRVSRDTLILSLWVDGNYQAWRRKRSESRQAPIDPAGRQRSRCVVSREQIEAEFRSVGFRILSHLDLLPGIAMLRVYILRKVP